MARPWARAARRLTTVAAGVALAAAAAAPGCSGSSHASATDAAIRPTADASAGSGGSGGSSAAVVCGATTSPPARYQHVVVFAFENRTWSDVGPGFSTGATPYLHSLAAQCSYFDDWTQTDTGQDSLTQYIGETSGVSNASTVDDCTPSASCQSTDDNIFRQVRLAGGTPRSYVEGATAGCSAAGNVAKHIPALYYFGTYTDSTGTHDDHDFCDAEVRPFSEFDVERLPTYALVTPNPCNDGHDCDDATADAWAAANVQKVLDSSAYRAGTVAVFVWYDESDPTPNIEIAPSSHRGAISQTGVATHAALLKTIEDLLGLPVMNQGQLPGATDLRSLLGM
jgi:hypothetical protein